MEEASVFDKVREIIVELMEVDGDMITPYTAFRTLKSEECKQVIEEPDGRMLIEGTTIEVSPSATELRDGRRVLKDLEADSLDLVELLMAFEDEFKSQIPDDDVREIVTVGNAVEYIETQLKEQP